MKAKETLPINFTPGVVPPVLQQLPGGTFTLALLLGTFLTNLPFPPPGHTLGGAPFLMIV